MGGAKFRISESYLKLMTVYILMLVLSVCFCYHNVNINRQKLHHFSVFIIDDTINNATSLVQYQLWDCLPVYYLVVILSRVKVTPHPGIGLSVVT